MALKTKESVPCVAARLSGCASNLPGFFMVYSHRGDTLPERPPNLRDRTAHAWEAVTRKKDAVGYDEWLWGHDQHDG